jgi:hypothetical protein
MPIGKASSIKGDVDVVAKVLGCWTVFALVESLKVSIGRDHSAMWFIGKCLTLRMVSQLDYDTSTLSKSCLGYKFAYVLNS